MIAITPSDASLAGAFLLGFIVGIITLLRLFAITFGVSLRTLKRHSIDHDGKPVIEPEEEAPDPND